MAELPVSAPGVLALTAQWLVVFKPAGWLTIPARESTKKLRRERLLENPQAPRGVLVEWARQRYGEILIVHRLDRETSGIVLFARTAPDHRTANLWFQNHQIKKTYDCLAMGIPAAPVLRLNAPIGGSPSVTQVEAVECYREGFLARVRPLTGRRHQIRIHLSQAGHPIWGDVLYKGPSSVMIGERRLGVARVALHASKLELPTGESFEAYWPPDFQGWVERLRADGHRV